MKKVDKEEVDRMITYKLTEAFALNNALLKTIELIREEYGNRTLVDTKFHKEKEEPRYLLLNSNIIGSSFPLPLTKEAKEYIIELINDANIETINLTKTK